MENKKSKILDGMTFEGEIAMKGSGAERGRECIDFAEGMFHSAACDQHGFNRATYRFEERADVTLFDAETTNSEGERMEWGGAIRGDLLEATAIRLKNGQKANEYSVRAWRAGAQQKKAA